MRAVLLLLGIFCFIVPGGCGADSNKPPAVETFSPEGAVKQIRQVAVRFTQAMARIGDPRQESPFAVDCQAQGTGRWVDAYQWAFDFAQDLPGGIRCAFRLKPGVRTLSGARLGGRDRFVFDTGGPAVADSLPEGDSTAVDEHPTFILKLNGAATADSILAHARCETDGLAERIEVNLIQGEDRNKLLNGLRPRFGYFFENVPDDRLAVVECRRNFPPESSLRLVWGAGVASPQGVAAPQDQVLSFKIRPAFTASFQCEKVNAKSHCVPFMPMSLSFSAPVAVEQASAVQLQDDQGKSYPPESLDPKLKPWVQNVKFKGPFPESRRFKITLPPGLADDAGRALENAGQFPLPVETDEYPPLAKFNGEFGILEASEGGVLPVTLRNLEASVEAKRAEPGASGIPGKLKRLDQDDGEIAAWLRKVKKAGEIRFEQLPKASEEEAARYRNLTGAESVFGSGEKTQAVELPKPNGAKAFEVVGIPLGAPGFYVVELASPRLGAALLGEARPRYVATSALVTNLSVHFKWGRESSVAWVTSLDKANPVAGAEVRVSDFCTGKVYWSGRTGPDGLARIEGAGVLPEPIPDEECYEGGDAHPLLITARADDDMSFAVSGWNKGIQPDDFKLTTGNAGDTRIAHAVFDRSLFRAGETVSMKLFLRRRTGDGFAAWNDKLPDALEIRHGGSGEKYVLAAAFDERGIAEASWPIPREAKLGGYDVSLRKGSDWLGDAGSFQVEQFRIPTMKALIQPAADFLVNARETTVDLFVNYLSGGGASLLPVKLRTQIRSRVVEFPDREGFEFGGRDIQEGVIENDRGGYEHEAAEESSVAQVLPLTLDKSGAARVKIPNLPAIDSAKELLTELEYQDANGQLLTVSRRIPLLPSKLILGLKEDGWAASKDHLRFQAIALDPAGKPAKGRNIEVELFKKTTYSYRKRLIGGFYDYEDKTEYQKLEPACENKTNPEGVIACDLNPGVYGGVVLRASSRDEQGNAAVATREVWVAGGGEWWFDNGASDRMDVLPEKKSLESGQKARLQVRMPFREATALVTVEREGVLDAFVTPLSGKEPVVELPIKPNYAPNVYVSVLAVRGRAREDFAWFRALAGKLGVKLEEKSATALIDLNKPAYRLGMAQLDVGWTPNRLEVKVLPDRETYQVRDNAHLKIKVGRADGGPPPADAEIALAAVDEGLLELRPNPSWKLLDRMMGKRGIEVYTATAQMQVVGKRHYGRKAVPHGGGGGRQTARELFDTLLLWRGRLPLDGQGEAQLDVPLNDSLTAFRLTAVANAGIGLFGTGDASIRSTQDIMLHSGLPPLVRENDLFRAVFTLRNASQRRLALTAKARWSALPPSAGEPAKTAEWKELPPQPVELAPGEARELAWEIKAPQDAARLVWEAGAEAADGSAADALKVSQEVIPAWPARVYQATLAQLDKPLQLSVQRPAGAIPGRGGVRVELRAKLGENLAGVADYMARYPYSCLEQRISKAVALRDPKQWEQAMKTLPAFIDREGLLKYFAAENLSGSDALTAYVLSIGHEAGWTLPEESRNRLLEGLRNFAAGRLKRGSVLPAADLSIRKLAVIEALSRYRQAKPEMLDSIAIEPDSWPTSAVLDWINILKRVESIPQRGERLRQAGQIVRSRLNLQGSRLGFSTEDNDRLWWLMVSPDENAVRALLTLLDLPPWRADVPRLATGALGRQVQGRWDTTVANAWGTLAMEKFSAAFESQAVTGTTQIRLGAERREWPWNDAAGPAKLDFPWSEDPAGLTLTHQGEGKPWALIQSRAALPLAQPLFTGFRIKRTVEPLEQRQAGSWSRGDVARIKLELEAQADMTWVVVDDPVPAGAAILGSGLGGSSSLLAAGEKREGRVWPAFEERRFEAFRAYYDYVPKGAWSFEYTIRLNNPGRFELPPTRVEALYAPEMFGELPNAALEIN